MEKLRDLGIIWFLVIVAYIMLGFLMPLHLELKQVAESSLNATANMSHFPGTLEAVQSYPYWIWAIPGLCGLVGSAITLKSKGGR